MRLMSSSSSFASSSLDLTLATSSDLILQICLIMALSGLSWSVAKFHWHGTWGSAHKSCIHGHRSCKRGGRMLELVNYKKILKTFFLPFSIEILAIRYCQTVKALTILLLEEWLKIFTRPANTCTCPLKAYFIETTRRIWLIFYVTFIQ